MAKKNQWIWIAVAAGAGYIVYRMIKNRSSVKVTAANPIKQSESEFYADQAEPIQYAQASENAQTPVEKVASIIKAVFPKKTAEQKAAKEAKKTAKKTARKAKKAKKIGWDGSYGLV